jgi:cytochrome c
MKKISALFILIFSLFFLSSNVIPQGGDPDNGAELYAQKCARCHGSSGQGGTGPSLRGCSICDSLQPLFEKINAEMPLDNPQDCIDTCARDTAAFIFVNLNGHSLGSSGTEDSGGGCFISISTE